MTAQGPASTATKVRHILIYLGVALAIFAAAFAWVSIGLRAWGKN
jgi:hypothetical protein